jgi:hypothetical protein
VLRQEKTHHFHVIVLRNAGRGWSMIVTVKEAEDTVKMCLYIYIYINNIFLSIKNLILIRALANNKKNNTETVNLKKKFKN